MLIQSPRNEILRPQAIAMELDIPSGVAVELVSSLIGEGLFQPTLVECRNCGAQNLFPDEVCVSCGQPLRLDLHLGIHVSGVISKAEQKQISAFEYRNRELGFLADRWKSTSVIFYLMLDVVGSEQLQVLLGDDTWRQFLDGVRHLLKYRVLSQMADRTVSFGEVGDMHKIAFSSHSDIFHFLEKLSGCLPAKERKGHLWFPCYSATIVPVPLPQDVNGKTLAPESVLAQTLDGAIDFSTTKLTRGYRLDSRLKTDPLVYEGDCNVTAWFLEGSERGLPVQDDIVWSEVSYRKGPVSGDDRACLAYFGEGQYLAMELDPASVRIE